MSPLAVFLFQGVLGENMRQLMEAFDSTHFLQFGSTFPSYFIVPLRK
jgi:hypothetical protein